MLFLFIFILLHGSEATLQRPCSEHMAQVLRNPQVLPDGSLDSEGVRYLPGLFWQENTTFWGCTCNVTRCLRLCTPAVYFDVEPNSTSDELTGTSEPFNLTVRHEVSDLVVTSHDHFTVLESQRCPEDHMAILMEPETLPDDKHVILSNGSLHLTRLNKLHGPELFCLYNAGDGEVLTVMCVSNSSVNISMTEMSSSLVHHIYPYFMLVSVLFLALTLLAFAVSPDPRNLHRRCQVSHATALMLAFLSFAIVQLAGASVSDVPCRMLACITHYFFMASFFWLNVMCFDIWWTFSGIRSMMGTTRSTLTPPTKKFVRYCLYAWGSPLTLALLVTILDTADIGLALEDRPGIGTKSCWFHTREAEFYYFNGPVALLLLINVYFFAHTLVRLVVLRRESSELKRGESRTSKKDKQSLLLYLKLFLVMGLFWVMEIISWQVGGHESYWYFTDILNLLQGVWIFLLSVLFTRLRDPFLARILSPSMAAKLSFYKPGDASGASVRTRSSEATESQQHGQQLQPLRSRPDA